MKGSLQGWERGYFSQENAQASCCQACRLLELQRKEASAFTGRSGRGVFGDHLALGLLGEELYAGLRVGPGSEAHGEERGAELRFHGLS